MLKLIQITILLLSLFLYVQTLNFIKTPDNREISLENNSLIKEVKESKQQISHKEFEIICITIVKEFMTSKKSDYIREFISVSENKNFETVLSYLFNNCLSQQDSNNFIHTDKNFLIRILEGRKVIDDEKEFQRIAKFLKAEKDSFTDANFNDIKVVEKFNHLKEIEIKSKYHKNTHDKVEEINSTSAFLSGILIGLLLLVPMYLFSKKRTIILN